MPAARPIILASASPRRRDVLDALGVAYRVEVSSVDETAIEAEDDLSFVRAAARAKLEDVLRAAEQRDPDLAGTFVLAADTIVSVDGEVLGKPRDDRDALRMLRALSGRSHWVRTAVALGRVGSGNPRVDLVSTEVWFRSVSRSDLERYVATGEGRDKAGAYAIQGIAGGFVSRIEGSYSNVVGLPGARVIELLTEQGALERWP